MASRGNPGGHRGVRSWSEADVMSVRRIGPLRAIADLPESPRKTVRRAELALTNRRDETGPPLSRGPFSEYSVSASLTCNAAIKREHDPWTNYQLVVVPLPCICLLANSATTHFSSRASTGSSRYFRSRYDRASMIAENVTGKLVPGRRRSVGNDLIAQASDAHSDRMARF